MISHNDVMEFDPTPGPWMIYEGGDIGSASVRRPPDTTVLKAGSVKGETIGQACRNAKLIAAAPELRDAAMFAVTVAHTCDCPFGEAYTPKSTCSCNYHDMYRDALAVLAKIEPADSLVVWQHKIAKRGNEER